MPNILIVYCANRFPLRTTIADHLYAVERYSGNQCFYFNAAVRRVPKYFSEVRFDLIIFHTTFLSSRWDREHFKYLTKKIEPLKALSGIRIAIPQDEFLNTDILGGFIRDFGVGHVFSVMPPDQWKVVYSTIDRDQVQIHSVLTGYLDDATVEHIKQLSRTASPVRAIDIGYRAWHAAYWLGRHGLLKVRVAQRFLEEAVPWGLKVDISTLERDTLLGDHWFKHLLNCRYTIGVEGGASILDYDGSIRSCTEAYLMEHPEASFDEVEEHCFPGLDGTVNLVAISPRHLEACATRTCQILVEGYYNGILKAGVHYLPLRKDLSNLGEVLGLLKDEKLRIVIADRAYTDIVESGLYSNRSFAAQLLQQSLPTDCPGSTPQEMKLLGRNRHDERVVNPFFALRSRLIRILEKQLPEERLEEIKVIYRNYRSLIDRIYS